MKTLVLLVIVGAGVYFMYGFMQKKKAEAKENEANAAVRYAKSLKADEDKAAKAVQAYNSGVHQSEHEMNQAAEAQ